MRLLITGGAGSLGSNLVAHLVPQGHQVLVLDSFATGKRGALPPAVEGLTVVEGDVADDALLARVFGEFGPTHVIHSAAAYKDPQDWAEDSRTNVLGSIAVAKAALTAGGVERLVNFQTALCYGRPDTVPIPVTHPLRPFTSYGISKTAGEQFLLQSGLPVTSLRLANVTGPRLAIGPIPTFYKRLKAGEPCTCSTTVRDFLDMSDFLALMDIVLRPGSPAGVYNVSTGEGRTIADVFEVVAAHLGVEAHAAQAAPGPDDVPAVVLDPSVTGRELGWTARVGFEDTVRGLLRWYDEFGVTDVYSHLAPLVPDGVER